MHTFSHAEFMLSCIWGYSKSVDGSQGDDPSVCVCVRACYSEDQRFAVGSSCTQLCYYTDCRHRSYQVVCSECAVQMLSGW
jgi:hypothetical protein